MPEGIDYKNIKLYLYSDDGPVDITINFPAQENHNYKKQKEWFWYETVDDRLQKYLLKLN